MRLPALRAPCSRFQFLFSRILRILYVSGKNTLFSVHSLLENWSVSDKLTTPSPPPTGLVVVVVVGIAVVACFSFHRRRRYPTGPCSPYPEQWSSSPPAPYSPSSMAAWYVPPMRMSSFTWFRVNALFLVWHEFKGSYYWQWQIEEAVIGMGKPSIDLRTYGHVCLPSNDGAGVSVPCITGVKWLCIQHIRIMHLYGLWLMTHDPHLSCVRHARASIVQLIFVFSTFYARTPVFLA